MSCSSTDGERKEAAAHYMRPLLHVYFIWDPVVFSAYCREAAQAHGPMSSVVSAREMHRAWRSGASTIVGQNSRGLLRGLDQFLQDGVQPAKLICMAVRSKIGPASSFKCWKHWFSVWGGNRGGCPPSRRAAGWNGMSDSDPDALFDYVANELNQFGSGPICTSSRPASKRKT